MRAFIALSLLAIISCTSETTMRYAVDYRYLQAIPDYADGRLYVSNTNDTVILKLTTTDEAWISANTTAPNGRDYSFQRLLYYYRDVSSTSLEMTFGIFSIPSPKFETPALTEINFSTPSKYSYTLRCTPTDTSGSNFEYFKTWQYKGKTYREVYADTSNFYYSMEGELIRFKAQGKWFDQP